MSEVKVNKISPRIACGTTTLGDSGDTFNIPAGVTISNNGTATGFGATGTVNWDVASIKTVDFSAVAGVGYFVDTATTGAVEVTLPGSPTAGDVVGFSDYAKNFNTNACTLNRNGSNIGGQAVNSALSTNGVAVTLVYVDATKGWIVTDSGNQDDAPTALFVAGTGGCVTTCGDYKVHTFLSPGTFTVSCTGNAQGSTQCDYLIVAGGGGGGSYAGGGGGAGGFRETPGSVSGSYTASPIAGSVSAFTVSATGYPVVIGAGGAALSNGCTSSVFSQVSTGGGNGVSGNGVGSTGGSGGGGSGGVPPGTGSPHPGGTGNNPPTSPAQGTAGGGGFDGVVSNTNGGGGGGATIAGVQASCRTGGDAGTGTTSCISFSPTAYSGGGGGATDNAASPGGTGGSASPCGTGGAGGPGGYTGTGVNGTTNRGGGAGGSGGAPGASNTGGTGGSGVVIIRYKYK